jgi:membrane associated rhomboid family serine protease
MLLGANVVVFALIWLTGRYTSPILQNFALIPVARPFPDGHGGAVIVDGVSEGAYYQLLTSMFTHVQIWHIGFNMLALYWLGPQLEVLLGRLRYAGLYLVSGLAGSVAVFCLAAPFSWTIGASGAIFGLMGALLVVAIKVRGNVQALVGLIVVNVVITFAGSSFISWQGHLGGLVGGTLLGSVLVYAPRQRRSLWQGAGFAVVTVLLAAATLARTAALT